MKIEKKYAGFIAIAFLFVIAGSIATEQLMTGITCKDCILDNSTFINTTFPGGNVTGGGSMPLNISSYHDMIFSNERAPANIYTTDNIPRSIEIVYDNSNTGGAIALAVTINSTYYGFLYYDGNTPNDFKINTLTAIIPAHSTYSYNDAFGCCVLYYWFEHNLTT